MRLTPYEANTGELVTYTHLSRSSASFRAKNTWVSFDDNDPSASGDFLGLLLGTRKLKYNIMLYSPRHQW